MGNSLEYGGWAYLNLKSSLPLSTICEHIGRSGEGRSWCKDDLNRRGQPYGFSSWKLESGLEKGEPLDAHVRALWNRVEDIRLSVIKLPDDVTRVLQCVGYFKHHSDAFALSSGHFATAAYYRLDWDFDFYFNDGFGNEDESKPYWEW